MNIKQILEYGSKLLKESNIDEPVLKARILLANILNKSKEYLLIHETDILSKDIIEIYIKDITKLCSCIPLQYIINKQEFMGLDFYVDKNVLIPQPDTEILVEEVINIIKKENKFKILDLCTGSGAIGICIAKFIKNSKVILSDVSSQALKVAKKNSDVILGKENIKIIESNLFENIEDKFDIIVSNPPYIKSNVIKTLAKEVQNEPKLALDGGKDGLKIYRRIIEKAYNFLTDGGYLCLEIGYDQKKEVIDLINNSNKYNEIYCKKDLSGNDRIIVCKKLSKKH